MFNKDEYQSPDLLELEVEMSFMTGSNVTASGEDGMPDTWTY